MGTEIVPHAVDLLPILTCPGSQSISSSTAPPEWLTLFGNQAHESHTLLCLIEHILPFSLSVVKLPLYVAIC